MQSDIVAQSKFGTVDATVGEQPTLIMSPLTRATISPEGKD